MVIPGVLYHILLNFHNILILYHCDKIYAIFFLPAKEGFKER